MAVIIDEIRKGAFLIPDFRGDEVRDGCSVALQELVARGVVDFDAVSIAELGDAGGGGAAGCDEG